MDNIPSRPALRYYGGKWDLAPWIISHFPSHKNYVEPCGGAASVLLQKPRSALETYNDLDGNVVNFFRVLRNKPEELIRKIELTPWAREEYQLSLMPCDDPIERARRYFIRLWMSVHGGTGRSNSKTWCIQTDSSKRFVMPAEQKIDTQKELYAIAKRFEGVQIDNRDALETISRYDNPYALIYLDPPYMAETRSNSKTYSHEWSDKLHRKAGDLLNQCAGYVIISGYACPLYSELYEGRGWVRRDKESRTNSGGKRIESIWISPKTWEALQAGAGLPLFQGVNL